MTELCYQIQEEPVLQPVSNLGLFSLSTANTQEGAHLEYCEWRDQSEHCFVDVRFLIFFALPNVNSISAAYRWCTVTSEDKCIDASFYNKMYPTQ